MSHTHTFRKEGKNATPCGQSNRNYIRAIMSEQSCLSAILPNANMEKEIDVLDNNYGWKLTCWTTIAERFFIAKYNPCTQI
jgi:hypothetical protein